MVLVPLVLERRVVVFDKAASYKLGGGALLRQRMGSPHFSNQRLINGQTEHHEQDR